MTFAFKKASGPFLISLFLPVLLFYAPCSFFVTVWGVVGFVVYSLVCSACKRSWRPLLKSGSQTLVFMLSLAILLWVAPRGGGYRQVGPVAFSDAPITAVVEYITANTGLDILIVDRANGISKEARVLTANEKRILNAKRIDFACGKLSLFSFANEFEQQTAMKIHFQRTWPLGWALSGHHDVLSITIIQ
jgi:hypothetical protein